MGSRGSPTYSLEELGIHLTADDVLKIDVDVSSDSSSEKIAVVFDRRSKRWKVSTQHVDSPNNVPTGQMGENNGNRQKSTTTWVDKMPDTEHVKKFKDMDWSTTPLGPLDTWSVPLQTLVNFLMTESMAAAIYWGPHLSAIYNAEMVKLNQDRLGRYMQHMGKSFQELWPEQWADLGSMLTEVTERGVPLDTLNLNLFSNRDSSLEETFWSGTFIPIRDPDGNIQGFFNRGRETTKEVVAERRTKTLNKIALSQTLATGSVWKQLFTAFRENDREFPMAFVYGATEDANTSIKLRLQESIGLSEIGHPLVPQELDLFGGQTGFVPYFRRARVTDQPLVLHRRNETLPESLIEGFEWQGFKKPSNSIAIIAINASDRLLGIMVMGLNHTRPYDVEYEGFLSSLSRHMSSVVTNAMDKEAADLRAARLTKRLEESEKRIRELAVHGLVGMVQVALNGKILWANDKFHELTGHSSKDEDQYAMSFLDVVDPRDREICANQWTRLVDDRKELGMTLRMKRRWKPPTSSDGHEYEEQPVWVTTSAYPGLEDGELKYIAASVTDISHVKWAEALESRNAAAAQEAKRLQENFIDIVSHEMRNPLSAITQLADGITMSLDDYERDENDLGRKIINENIDSAKTILLCAAHQKRIIDDVLTLSKLDSMMLSITPVVVQPRKVVEAALKMFEGEFQTNEIDFHIVIDESYDELNVEWVSLDPSRLTQIFINLITNAIKFTKLEKRKEIKVRTSVNTSRPPTIAGVTWFPTNKKYRDLTQGKEWGTGQELFLCFEVQDTGRGLEQEEMQKLFSRFQQATAKTHIKYGGSGLGLFISRELTETQGGEIGVVSEPGKGSTFAFYVKGRRADLPDDPARMTHTRHSDTDRKPSLRRESSGDSAESTGHQHDPDKPVLLLAEDNIVNAKVLTRQLERARCKVHNANHGMEALDLLSKTQAWIGASTESNVDDIDCILMDVEMPIMDGLTCTRRIRQLEKEGRLTKHMNIIVITANARQEQIDNVMSAGADDVMPKPFRVRELLAKVAEVKARTAGK